LLDDKGPPFVNYVSTALVVAILVRMIWIPT